MRIGNIQRKTAETDISLTLSLDGGEVKLVEIDGIGIGFSVCLKRQQRLSRGSTGDERKSQEKDGEKQSG